MAAVTTYFLWLDEKEQGPFVKEELREMITSGQLARSALCRRLDEKKFTPLTDGRLWEFTQDQAEADREDGLKEIVLTIDLALFGRIFVIGGWALAISFFLFYDFLAEERANHFSKGAGYAFGFVAMIFGCVLLILDRLDKLKK